MDVVHQLHIGYLPILSMWPLLSPSLSLFVLAPINLGFLWDKKHTKVFMQRAAKIFRSQLRISQVCCPSYDSSVPWVYIMYI